MLVPPARAQDPGTVYVVTYVEVKPTAQADASALLKSYRDATRGDAGNLRSEVVQHATRPGQFVILAAWKDQKAMETHTGAAGTGGFRERIEALRNSPLDERIHGALSVGSLDEPRGAVHVVTHVDVVPPRRDDAIAALRTLAVETWSSREAFDQHGMAVHVREFRDKLKPMSGALYDERLYGPLN
jgi:quinol monooxygenase YgiN